MDKDRLALVASEAKVTPEQARRVVEVWLSSYLADALMTPGVPVRTPLGNLTARGDGTLRLTEPFPLLERLAAPVRVSDLQKAVTQILTELQ